jgi:hypothetical protein
MSREIFGFFASVEREERKEKRVQLYISTVSEETYSTCVMHDTKIRDTPLREREARLYVENSAKSCAVYEIKLVRLIGAGPK